MLKNLLILALVLFSSASLGVDQASKDEIIKRCKTQMGDYGAAMIKACVDQDFAAWESVEEYKNTHPKIHNRCFKRMQEYGFTMIEACIQQDAEAAEQIGAIPQEYEPIVTRCKERMEVSYGHAMVLACAKQDIEAEEALKKY